MSKQKLPKNHKVVNILRQSAVKFRPLKRKFSSTPLNGLSSTGLREHIEAIVFIQSLSDKGNVFNKTPLSFDYKGFDQWLKSNWGQLASSIRDMKSLEAATSSLKQRYINWRKVHSKRPWSFMRTHRPKTTLKIESKKSLALALASYNQLVDRPLSGYLNAEDFHRDLIIALAQFRAIGQNFKDYLFVKWLVENNHLMHRSLTKLKQTSPQLTLGEFLAIRYKTFNPTTRMGEFRHLMDDPKIRKLIDEDLAGQQKRFEACGKNDKCLVQKASQWMERIATKTKLKNSFQCMAKNPIVIRNTLIDMGISFFTLGVSYATTDLYQRFPWEYVASGLTFSLWVAESHCRSTFDLSQPLGKKIHNLKQHRRNLNKSRLLKFGHVVKSATVSIVFFTAYIYFFDNLYTWVGHPIENPANLEDSIKMLPFYFLYFPIFSNLAAVATKNPIRLKLIPQFAKWVADKSPALKSPLFYDMVMTNTFNISYEYARYYIYEDYYKPEAVLWMMDKLGIETQKSGQQLKIKNAHITELDNEAIDGKNYQVEYENGVKYQVEVKTINDKGKQYLLPQLKGLDIPPEVWRQVLGELPDTDDLKP